MRNGGTGATPAKKMGGATRQGWSARICSLG
jgi:hypothetical protein